METSPFALLGLPARPLIADADLQERFHLLSRQWHPDSGEAGSSEAFAALNAAHATLADPPQRLRALLAETFPEINARIGAIPDAMMDIFQDMAEHLPRLDTFLTAWENASTALGRALLTAEKFSLSTEKDALRARLTSLENSLEARLKSLDAIWDAARQDASTGQVLAGLAQEWAFLRKWQSQLSQRETRWQVLVDN